jgi:hypothetical protein
MKEGMAGGAIPLHKDVEGTYWRAFSVTNIGHIRVDFVKVVRVLLEDQD